MTVRGLQIKTLTAVTHVDANVFSLPVKRAETFPDSSGWYRMDPLIQENAL